MSEAAAPRARTPILPMLGLLVGVLLALQLTYSEPGLLYLAPAILLLTALVFSYYPGERLLAAAAHSWHRVVRRPGPAPPQRPGATRPFPRGGVLLAMAFAGRGPPA